MLVVAFAESPRQATGIEYRSVRLIDANPTGGDYINGLINTGDRFLFEAFDGALHKIYSTDGRSVTELMVEGNGSLNPEPMAIEFYGRPSTEYFVANGPEGRSLYKTDGAAAEVLASGVTGTWDYDLYVPSWAWKTDDYLYFHRKTTDAEGLYRTDGSAIARAGITNGTEVDYEFLSNFQGDALLVGSGPDGDFLVRENVAASTKITLPSGLAIDPWSAVQIGERLGFTGSFGAGQRLFLTDGESVEMIDFNLGTRGVGSPVAVGEDLFFKGQSNDGPRYEKIFHFDGETIKPLELGNGGDHSRFRIIATLGNEVMVVGGLKVQLTDGLAYRTIAENVQTNVGGGAWLFAQTATETILTMDTSAGRGLYRVVGDEAVPIDFGSTSGGGLANSRTQVLGDAVYFSAVGRNGDELFRLVGGEVTEFDINPLGNSNPENLQVVGDSLFFTATGPKGREAYLLQGDNLSLIDINLFGDSDPWFMGEVDGAILVKALTGRDLSSSARELIAIYRVPEPASTANLLVVAGTCMACYSRCGYRHRNCSERRAARSCQRNI